LLISLAYELCKPDNQEEWLNEIAYVELL